jgi:uncharacterized protein DUF4365
MQPTFRRGTWPRRRGSSGLVHEAGKLLSGSTTGSFLLAPNDMANFKQAVQCTIGTIKRGVEYMSPKVKTLIDREGVQLSGLIFTRDLKWIFREQSISDVGIDAIVEVVSEGVPTGELLAIQIKSGDSFFREKEADRIIFRCDSDHLEYWLRCQVPVLLILYSPRENRCFWQAINDESVEITGKNGKILVPLANQLDRQSAEPIRAFFKTWQSTRRRSRFPAEDELSVVLHWLGRCKLVHRLDAFLYPPGALEQFRVPDLLASFEVDGDRVPVLIEVTEMTSGGVPIWEKAYISSLQRYADREIASSYCFEIF